ncbi:MAG: hypothetical protein IPM55_21740 [Acidobacteria bacterium]|nr:hypothetical protein [Acidobacteriota bacterium]
MKEHSQEEYDLFRQTVAHLLMGLGGEDDQDTRARIAAHGPISDADIVPVLTAVLRAQEAFNHKQLQSVDVRLANGQSGLLAYGGAHGLHILFMSRHRPSIRIHHPMDEFLFQGRHHGGGGRFWESFIVDHSQSLCDPRTAG